MAAIGRWTSGLLAIFTLAAMGCDSTPPPVPVPPINPSAVGAAAIKQYDKNGDGKLDGAELDSLPAVKSNLARYDKNGDKAVAADEIAARLQGLLDSQIGLMSFQCIVTLDGKPLEGATIELIPEDCMGGSVDPAKGTTGPPQGMAVLAIADDKLPEDMRGKNFKSVRVGLYKIKITHPTAALPAKYNTATTLGQDIAPDVIATGIITYALTSK